MSTFKKAIIKGTLWSVFGQCIALLIVLATNIWLARLLSPKEFGQVGIVMFFLTLGAVFTEGGLAGALVRKKEATVDDYSTVFVFNLLVSLFCYLLLFFGSWPIADYYHEPTLGLLIKVSGLVLIINAFQITQNARLMSELKFKQKSVYRIVSVIIGSASGLLAGYNGFGVWSLVIVQLVSAGMLTILLWIFEGTFVRITFNRGSFKELYGFGVNTTLASLMDTAFDNIYQLILGKYFSITEVGFFYQAKKLQDVPGGLINMVTQSVVFSSLAKLQDDKPSFIRAYNKITLYFLVALGFISCCIFIYAKQIVILLYGQKWLGAVFYMQLLTLASFFYFSELINRVIFKVFNQTKQILYLEFIKKTIHTCTIVVGIIYLDLRVLIIGFVITNMISYSINYYYSRKIIGAVNRFEIYALLKIILTAFLSIIFLIYTLNYFKINNYIAFFTFPVLVFVYFGGLKILKIFSLKEEYTMLLHLFKNKNAKEII